MGRPSHGKTFPNLFPCLPAPSHAFPWNLPMIATRLPGSSHCGFKPVRDAGVPACWPKAFPSLPMKAVEILLARDCAFRDSARAWQTPGRSLADSRKPGRLRKGTIIKWCLLIPFTGYLHVNTIWGACRPMRLPPSSYADRRHCLCGPREGTRRSPHGGKARPRERMQRCVKKSYI